jgi:DNA-binding protein H-NS
MTVNLETLSPKELQALIESAHSQMQAAQAGVVADVKAKIEALLSKNGLTLADVYPSQRGGVAAKGGKKGSVAPKFRNPANAEQTWSGRGKRPLWFVDALRRRGVTADDLLISGAPKAAAAPAKAAKAAKSAKKATRKVAKRATKKTAGRKAAKR